MALYFSAVKEYQFKSDAITGFAEKWQNHLAQMVNDGWQIAHAFSYQTAISSGHKLLPWMVVIWEREKNPLGTPRDETKSTAGELSTPSSNEREDSRALEEQKDQKYKEVCEMLFKPGTKLSGNAEALMREFVKTLDKA